MKHWRVSLVGCLALTLVLSACGGGSKATSTVQVSAATPSPTATMAAVGGNVASPTIAVSPTTPATATSATTPTSAPTATAAEPTATKPAAATATTANATATSAEATEVPTDTSEPTPAFDPDVMTRLNSATLTLDDFPDGWTQQASQPSDNTDTDLCNNPAFDQTGARLGDVEIDSQASDAGPFVYQALTEFSDETADDAWTFAMDAASCTDWTETDSDGVETTYHLQHLDDPELGDESMAIELTFDVPDLGSATSDAIYIRVGNAFTLVAWTALGPVDFQDLLDLATRAADKLQAAYAE